MSDLTVDVVFCDDARREADGRLSLMGVFEGVRILPAGLSSLPKLTLCALVSAAQGSDLSDVVIKVSVFRDGALEHEDSYPSMPLVAQVDQRWLDAIAAAGIEYPLRAQFAGLLEFQNLPVHDGCVIKVSTHRGNELLFEHGVVLLQDDTGKVDSDAKYSVVQTKRKPVKKKVAR